MAKRDTQVEDLDPGDEFVWGGRTFEVRRRFHAPTGLICLETTEPVRGFDGEPRQRVVEGLDGEEQTYGLWRTFVGRVGFVLSTP